MQIHSSLKVSVSFKIPFWSEERINFKRRETAKSTDEIIRKQPLESLNSRTLGSFLPTNWERNHIVYLFETTIKVKWT